MIFKTMISEKEHEKAIERRDAEWVAVIDELISQVGPNKDYAPMTEHERGWKNALLMLKSKMEVSK